MGSYYPNIQTTIIDFGDFWEEEIEYHERHSDIKEKASNAQSVIGFKKDMHLDEIIGKTEIEEKKDWKRDKQIYKTIKSLKESNFTAAMISDMVGMEVGEYYRFVRSHLKKVEERRKKV